MTRDSGPPPSQQLQAGRSSQHRSGSPPDNCCIPPVYNAPTASCFLGSLVHLAAHLLPRRQRRLAPTGSAALPPPPHRVETQTLRRAILAAAGYQVRLLALRAADSHWDTELVREAAGHTSAQPTAWHTLAAPPAPARCGDRSACSTVVTQDDTYSVNIGLGCPSGQQLCRQLPLQAVRCPSPLCRRRRCRSGLVSTNHRPSCN